MCPVIADRFIESQGGGVSEIKMAFAHQVPLRRDKQRPKREDEPPDVTAVLGVCPVLLVCVCVGYSHLDILCIRIRNSR